MIRVVLGIFIVTLVDWVNGQVSKQLKLQIKKKVRIKVNFRKLNKSEFQGIIFTDEGKNQRPLRSLQVFNYRIFFFPSNYKVLNHFLNYLIILDSNNRDSRGHSRSPTLVFSK